MKALNQPYADSKGKSLKPVFFLISSEYATMKHLLKNTSESFNSVVGAVDAKNLLVDLLL